MNDQVPLPQRAGDERYRLLVDSIPEYGILMLDPTGHVMSWNQGAESILGYRPEEIIGKHFSAFYPADRIASGWPEYELAEATRTGRFEDEGWRLRKDGSRFWANVVIAALRAPDGSIVGYGKITRDLSERRRQEEALRQSEERFRLLVEGAKDYAIFMLDATGHVATWNPGAEAINGYKADEIIGRHFSTFYPPEAIARNWPENELQIAREHGRFEEEGWRVRKDGTTFWANVTITALYDGEGKVRGFVKITRDLTSRKRFEELQRSERQMNGFLAMLAHELRNPLDPIRHALDLMSIRSDDLDTQTWARQVIDRQVGQLSRLVDDLLDVSRITMGKITLKLERVNLKELVAGVVESVRPSAQARKHTLAVKFVDDVVECRADPARVSQIVLNMLNNSIKYTPPGGRITAVVLREGSFAEVRVIDTGLGMSPDLAQSVFEPFVQGDRTLDRAEGGLGLGLTLVRRLAEMHGGSVSAHSEGEGKGSTFTVRFPLLTRKSAAVAAASMARPAAVARRRRVLVVDDNIDAATMLAALLETAGHDVWTVHDGEGALTLAQRQKPEVVLLDIGLPGINGYEVAKRLRQLPGLEKATLIACTGYGQDADRNDVHRAGFDYHLVKPVEPKALEELLAGSDRADG